MQLIFKIRLLSLIAIFCAGVCGGAWAQDFYSAPPPKQAEGKPAALTNVGIDQHLDQQLPLDLKFRDEFGKPVKLGDYFGQRPVILTLVYYTCPMLCSEVERGMASTFKILKFEPGREFDAVSVSINPNETPQDAMAEKEKFMKFYDRPGTESGVHLLVGDQANITALAKAVGFRYGYDSVAKQYSHATAIMVVTPQGKLAQYFYGIEYSPNDVRLALVAASKEKIGNLADAVLLYCFHYDPSTGRYSLAILNVVRVAGLATLFGLVAFMMVSIRRERKPQHARSAAGQN